jgi:hypothetical protein
MICLSPHHDRSHSRNLADNNIFWSRLGGSFAYFLAIFRGSRRTRVRRIFIRLELTENIAT